YQLTCCSEHGSCGCRGVKGGFRTRCSHCGSRATSSSEVHFDAGTKLIVLEAGQGVTPPTVTLLPPSPEENPDHRNKDKRTKTLVCVVTGFFPDHVSVWWQIDGGVVTSGVATDAESQRDHAHYGTSSRLSVDADTWFTPGRAFRCTATFFDGNQTSSHSDTVYGIQDTMTRGRKKEECHALTDRDVGVALQLRGIGLVEHCHPMNIHLYTWPERSCPPGVDVMDQLLTEESMKLDKLLGNVIRSADVILWGTTPATPPPAPPAFLQPPPPAKVKAGTVDYVAPPPQQPAAAHGHASGDLSPVGDAACQQLETLLESLPCMDDDLSNVLDDFWLPDYLSGSEGTLIIQEQDNKVTGMSLSEVPALPPIGRVVLANVHLSGRRNGEVMCGPPSSAATISFDVPSGASQSMCYSGGHGQPEGERPYIKKPPNAFMLFRKEQSPNVVAQFNITNSAAVNKILGKMWKSLPKKLQAKYYQQAEEHKVLHSLQHPDWSCTENYGKKRKRDRGRHNSSVSVMAEEFEHGPYRHYQKCAARDTQTHGC
ncbi:uncharacterized protein LOC133542609, partial [Nerophis ophidion]|uniref:uncharacterized protein LOC133542609 n=1 Tax=Nerophis ophidion TaxID=159077 RepID=UPI002AE09FE0